MSLSHRKPEPMSAETLDLLSIRDAAQYLACSPRSIRNYVASGRLPAYRLGTADLRFDRADLNAFLTPVVPSHRRSAR